ncbi:MAG: replication protein [Bacteroidota bacterium]
MFPNTTPVPNSVFDLYMKDLKSAELKVLLIIIRQTLGWTDRRAVLGRKEIDWISSGQLQNKTGSSRRAITSAIEILVGKNLIEVLDQEGNILKEPHMRKGKLRLFYRSTLTRTSVVENVGITGVLNANRDEACARIAQDLRKKSLTLAHKMRITKETLQN